MRSLSNRQIRVGLVCVATVSVVLLSGCATALPPYVVLFESYFPSWLVCAAAGCVAALVARVLLVRLAIDEYLPFPLLTYLAIAAIVMFLLSLLVFSR